MTLFLHGERFDVASLGPNDIVVRSARPMPAGEGTIRLTIDGELTVFHVKLADGIDPVRRAQSYQLIDTIEEAAA